MCFNITLHDPGNSLTSGRVWKVGVCAELPHQQLLPSLSFRSYSVYPTSASESWIKKASYKHSSQMTWKDGRAPKKTCLWPFVMCCWLLVVLLRRGWMLPPTQFSIASPSESLVLTGFPWAPSDAQRVILIPFHTSMWNWGHMARASVLESGGNSSYGRHCSTLEKIWKEWSTRRLENVSVYSNAWSKNSDMWKYGGVHWAMYKLCCL